MRIYWARGCPAFQLGPSRSCTRGGPARESVLRVPVTASPAFLRMSAALQSSHIATGPSHRDSWVPSLLSDLGYLYSLPCLGFCLLILHGRRLPSYQKTGLLAVSITDSMEADGGQVSLSVSHRSCCSLRSLSLSLHLAQTCPDARASGPREPGIQIPWQEEEAGPEQGVGQPTGQGPRWGQEELGFSTEG